MGITIEQLQDRSEARNPAQWDWRLLDSCCHAAGNSAVLNLNFGGESPKKGRAFVSLGRERIKARLRSRRAHLRSWSGPGRLQWSNLPYMRVFNV